ncbi:flagellar assembly protein H, partial [Arthrospira platensis SPKY2]
GLIRQILRRDVMRESVVYQEILQEGELIGEQRGILAGKQQVAINLLRQGMTVEQVVTVTELPRDVVEKLRDDNG